MQPRPAPGRVARRWRRLGAVLALLVGSGLLVACGADEDDPYEGLDCIALERELFFAARRGADEQTIDRLEDELLARCHDEHASATPAAH